MHVYFQDGLDAHGIAGAEYWVQLKDSSDQDVGFHYDKDEWIASNEMRMVFPSRSTVTYLTDYGGPTMIINQTTDRHGLDIKHRHTFRNRSTLGNYSPHPHRPFTLLNRKLYPQAIKKSLKPPMKA